MSVSTRGVAQRPYATMTSGIMSCKHLSQRDGHRFKSQVTECTAQTWSTQRALASKGEVYVQIVTSPLLSQLVDSADEAKTVPIAYTNCRFHCERKIRSCHTVLVLLSPSQRLHSTSSRNKDTSSIMEMTRLKSTLLSVQAMEIQLTRGDPGEFLGAARARRATPLLSFCSCIWV